MSGRVWDDEPPDEDLVADVEDRVQVRLYALEAALKAYDLVTEAEDDAPGPEWILEEAKRYAEFLEG